LIAKIKLNKKFANHWIGRGGSYSVALDFSMKNPKVGVPWRGKTQNWTNHSERARRKSVRFILSLWLIHTFRFAEGYGPQRRTNYISRHTTIDYCLYINNSRRY